jgi:hypothetical protein
MFVPVFINLNTPPCFLVKLSYLNCLDVHIITIKINLFNAYACIRVDLPDGMYTLTQEGDGTVDGELNQIGVQQDLDQSPEVPKAGVSVESEEGKHRFHLTHVIN